VTAASRARLLAELGRFDQAEAELRLGLLTRPGDPDLLALLAAVLRLNGRHDDALAAADAAIEAGPGSAGAHAERAENLIALSRTPEAIEAATEAARLRPAEPEVHRVLARAHAASRDFRQARAAAREALALDARSVPSLLTLAEVERVAGRRRAAARATRAALAEDPENPGGRWLIALLNAERLHVGEAMRGLRELAADHPDRLRAEALAWPILGVLAGLQRGLAVGVPLTVAVRLAAPWWGLAGLLAMPGAAAARRGDHRLGRGRRVGRAARLARDERTVAAARSSSRGGGGPVYFRSISGARYITKSALKLAHVARSPDAVRHGSFKLRLIARHPADTVFVSAGERRCCDPSLEWRRCHVMWPFFAFS
jgi:cytochrome c-type biogenesis protein CcmH/NrfG